MNDSSSTFSVSINEIIKSKHFRNRSNNLLILFKEIISILENEFKDDLSIIKLSFTSSYIAFYRMDVPQKRIFLTLNPKKDKDTKQEIFHSSVKVADENLRADFKLKKQTKKNRIPWGKFDFGTIEEFKRKIEVIRHSFNECIER